MDIGFSKTDAGRVAAGFQSENNDCTVRAWSTFFDVPYSQAHQLLEKAGRRVNKGMATVNIKYALHEHGAVCQLGDGYPRMRSASITLNQLVKKFPSGKIYCLKRGHAFTVVDGVVHDLSRIGKKTRVFSFYTLPGTKKIDEPKPEKKKARNLYYPTVIDNIIAKNTTISKHCIAKMISDQWNVSVASAYYHVRKYYSK